MSEEHNAEAIAKLITDTNTDDRHHLYMAIAKALNNKDQNYQASHFHALAKIEKQGGHLIVMP